jgi:hypothetical protein
MPEEQAAFAGPIPGWDNPAEWASPLPMPAASSPLRGVLREILRARYLTSDGLLTIADSWVQEACQGGPEKADRLAGAEFCRALAPLYGDVPLCPYSRALGERGIRFDAATEVRHG